MSAPDWFHCYIHSMDEDVLKLAALTGEDRYTVVGRCVDWFRWIDQHLSNAHSGLLPASLNIIVGMPEPRQGLTDYASAMQQVGWLVVDSKDGTLIVRGYERNFSQAAKRRAVDAKRKARTRGGGVSAKCPHSSGQISDTSRTDVRANAELEEKRREEKQTARAVCERPTPRAPPKPAKPRRPDPIWDAVCAEWGLNGTVKSHKSRIGGLVRDLKALGATPDEIRKRRGLLLERWGPGTDTPESVVKHWGEMVTQSPRDASRQAQAIEAATREEELRRVKAERKAAEAVLQRHTREEVENAYQAFLAEQKPGRVRDYYEASGLACCSKFVADRLEPGAVDELVEAKR